MVREEVVFFVRFTPNSHFSQEFVMETITAKRPERILTLSCTSTVNKVTLHFSFRFQLLVKSGTFYQNDLSGTSNLGIKCMNDC